MALLAYPEKFYAATKVANVPKIESQFTDETRLLLYALKEQALNGPTEIRSKWQMTREERGKYETYYNLGKMDRFEAMRLYVKLLSEENEKWFELVNAKGEVDERYLELLMEREGQGRGVYERQSLGAQKVKAITYYASTSDQLQQWETVDVSSSSFIKPCPRYQHGACVNQLGTKMIVSGGSWKGRFLSDTFVFCFMKQRWLKVEYSTINKEEVLPAISGHRLVTLRDGHCYSFGGKFSKTSKKAQDTDLAVFKLVLMDEEKKDNIASPSHDGDASIKGHWVPVHIKGKRGPCARRGLSCTKVGNDGDVIIFGGEDEERRYLNDCWRLDYKTMSWVDCATITQQGGSTSVDTNNTANAAVITPQARSEHVAIPWGRDKMIIFGGTGASFKCFDDLYALDINTGKWKVVTASMSSAPGGSPVQGKKQQSATSPLARAGHCVASVKNDRYALIIGGGNNQNGVLESAIY